MITTLLQWIPRPVMHSLSSIFLKIAPVLYYGKRFTDPIDGKTYRKFFSYGYSAATRRDNALSPGTLSLERHRLIWLWLTRETDFFKRNYRMLHVAPERCFVERFKSMKNLELITADLESPWADIKMDLHSIPFPDNHFEVIFCNHVLEHVTDDRQCMQELYRVLKPGGWAVLQSPVNILAAETIEDPSITDPKERERLFGQYDHVRMYGRDYAKRLESAGFSVEEIDYVSKLPEADAKKYAVKGPSGDDALFIGRKSAQHTSA